MSTSALCRNDIFTAFQCKYFFVRIIFKVEMFAPLGFKSFKNTNHRTPYTTVFIKASYSPCIRLLTVHKYFAVRLGFGNVLNLIDFFYRLKFRSVCVIFAIFVYSVKRTFRKSIIFSFNTFKFNFRRYAVHIRL